LRCHTNNNDDTFKAAAEDVRKTLPGARVNQIIRKAKKVGGLVSANGEWDDTKIFAP